MQHQLTPGFGALPLRRLALAPQELARDLALVRQGLVFGVALVLARPELERQADCRRRPLCSPKHKQTNQAEVATTPAGRPLGALRS